jgi:hypothetical protein
MNEAVQIIPLSPFVHEQRPHAYQRLWYSMIVKIIRSIVGRLVNFFDIHILARRWLRSDPSRDTAKLLSISFAA